MDVQDENKFADDVIAEIAKLIQIAILTGTDVVDNLRTLRVAHDSEKEALVLSDAYKESSEGNIQKLMSELESHVESMNNQDNQEEGAQQKTVELF